MKAKRRLTPEVAASRAARRSQAITGYHSKKENVMTPQEAVEIEEECASYALNDLGNAKRLVTRFGKELAQPHLPAEVVCLAIRTVEAMFVEADFAFFSGSCDIEHYEALLAWAKASGSRERIEAMIYLARGLMVKP